MLSESLFFSEKWYISQELLLIQHLTNLSPMISCEARPVASSRIRVWLALLCAGMLLMSTVAQALDSCESLPLRTSHHACGERSNQSSPAVCLICVSAHSPSLASAVTPVSAPIETSNVSGSPRQSFHAALHVFALQVRPPPSA